MSKLFQRSRHEESGEDIAFKTWQDRVYRPRLEYSRAQLIALKKNPYPEAASDTERLELHANNMQKIAVAVVAETLHNMSHEKCAKFLQNTERLEQVIYDGTQQAVACPDIHEFYPSLGLSVSDTHRTLSRSICQQIVSQWNEIYSLKDMHTHDAIRFQKHFIKNLSPLTSAHAIADAFEPKIAASLEGPPPLVPLEETIDESDLLEPPPLTFLEEPASRETRPKNSLLDSIRWEKESLIDNITWDDDVSRNLPARPAFRPYDELASAKGDGPPPLQWFSTDDKIGAKDDGPPPLKWISKSDNVRENSADARRKLARQKLRPVAEPADISIAVQWLRKAVENGDFQSVNGPLTFFAPTNKTVSSFDAIDSLLKPGIVRNVLGAHLCVAKGDGTYLSVNNKTRIKVDNTRIVQPAVKSATLHPADTLQVGSMTIRCFAHDNLMT